MGSRLRALSWEGSSPLSACCVPLWWSCCFIQEGKLEKLRGSAVGQWGSWMLERPLGWRNWVCSGGKRRTRGVLITALQLYEVAEVRNRGTHFSGMCSERTRGNGQRLLQGKLAGYKEKKKITMCSPERLTFSLWKSWRPSLAGPCVTYLRPCFPGSTGWSPGSLLTWTLLWTMKYVSLKFLQALDISFCCMCCVKLVLPSLERISVISSDGKKYSILLVPLKTISEKFSLKYFGAVTLQQRTQRDVCVSYVCSGFAVQI